jgi:hypothetical protein
MKRFLIFTVLFSLGISVFAQSAGSDATLRSLTVSHGVLVPEFSPNVTEYTVDVPYEVNYVTFNATPNDTEATVRQNPQEGDLGKGETYFDLICMAEDENTQILYKVVVKRAPDPNRDPNLSTDATLKSLTVSHGVLVPEFSPDVTEYTLDLPCEVDYITFNATPNDSGAMVRLNHQEGNLSRHETHFDFICMAEDEEAQILYRVIVNRDCPPDPEPVYAKLSSLTASYGSLVPEFNPDVTEYTVDVPYEINYIEFYAMVMDTGATIRQHNYPHDELPVGTNFRRFTCKAEGKKSTDYEVTVNRAPDPNRDPNISIDATLRSLTVSRGVLVPEFNPDVTEYTLDVPYEVNYVTSNVAETVDVPYDAATLTFNATANDAETTILPAMQHQLRVGENACYFSCTAEDGETRKTYRIAVNKTAPAPGYVLSNDSTLKSLTVSPGILVPDFDPNVTEYTVDVADSVKFVAFKGTPNHPMAWVQNFSTQLGDNDSVFHSVIVCRAEDKKYAKHYRVTINRATPFRNPMSAYAMLSSLTVSHGVLLPEFSPDVTNYTVSVPDTTTFVTFGATPTHSGATVSSEGGWTHPLIVARITCRSEDRTRQRTYRIAVNRDIPTSGSEPYPYPVSEPAFSEPKTTTTDVAQPTAKSAINLYQESGLSIVIEAEVDLIKEVEVFDLSGKILHKSSYSGVSRANWQANQKGLYLVKIKQQSGNSVYKKIIVW